MPLPRYLNTPPSHPCVTKRTKRAYALPASTPTGTLRRPQTPRGGTLSVYITFFVSRYAKDTMGSRQVFATRFWYSPSEVSLRSSVSK